MSKGIKKIVGLVVLAAVLVTTAGTSAQAAKWIKWPYGTYKGTGSAKGFKLDWQFGDDRNGYDEFVRIYVAGAKAYNTEKYKFKRTKTVNKYKSKNYPMKGARKIPHYFTIKVKSKSLVFKEYYDGKLMDTMNFKIQKRLSKNVG